MLTPSDRHHIDRILDPASVWHKDILRLKAIIDRLEISSCPHSCDLGELNAVKKAHVQAMEIANDAARKCSDALSEKFEANKRVKDLEDAINKMIAVVHDECGGVRHSGTCADIVNIARDYEVYAKPQAVKEGE